MSEKPLLDLLQQHGMEYLIHEHEPAFTCEQCEHLYAQMPGAHCKSLFLKDKKGRFFMVCILKHKRADLKELSKQIANGRLSFASPEELLQKLKLIPGSVTPYGLIHDTNLEVALILDKELLEHDIVNFHPLRNDQTLALKLSCFLQFFQLINHYPAIQDLPVL